MTAAGKLRRTQAERTAITRKILLDATVKCLYELGYRATTTNLVAEEAGISRGGMLHQFPSKADLMAFVVEADFEENVALYRSLLADRAGPRERLIGYPKATWRVWSRPSGVAVLEIMLASRSDPALRERLAPVLVRVENHAREELNSDFPKGISTPLLNLIVAVARGLSTSQIVARDDEEFESAIDLFEEMLKLAIDGGLFSPRKGAPG